MTGAEYLFLSVSSLPSSLSPSTYTGTAQGGWPLPATHVHTKSYRYSLCHTRTHTHAAPFLLTYPELSGDRLAVTQYCPATSDLPESSERADPWLTTEIQLPNQAGRQERGEAGYGSKGWWADRKKLKWTFAICGSPSSLPHSDPSSPCPFINCANFFLSFFYFFFLFIASTFYFVDCFSFMMAVEDKTQRRQRCGCMAWLQ